jgi:hypothetical protein
MEVKIRVQFIGKKSRTTKQDLLPIYLRATIQGKRFEARLAFTRQNTA